MAKRKLPESPDINTPVIPSIGPRVRHIPGRSRSPVLTVE
jgi:hypothetical protein